MTNDRTVTAVTRLPDVTIADGALPNKVASLLAAGWDTESLAYSFGKTQGYIDYLGRLGAAQADATGEPTPEDGQRRWVTATPYQESRQKNQQTLPEAVRTHFEGMMDEGTRAAYIIALREHGWTLQAIADAAELSRERVRQIAEAGTDTELPEGFDVPEIPVLDIKPRAVYVEPSPDTLARMLALKEPARLARGVGSKHWDEGLEFSNLLQHAIEVEGVTPNRLAKRLDMEHTALRLRAIRYGHRPSPETVSRLYTRIKGM